MKTGWELCKERGIDFSKGGVSAEEFKKVGLPMVVRCYNCEMTMALPRAAEITTDGKVFCEECAGGHDG